MKLQFLRTWNKVAHRGRFGRFDVTEKVKVYSVMIEHGKELLVKKFSKILTFFPASIL